MKRFTILTHSNLKQIAITERTLGALGMPCTATPMGILAMRITQIAKNPILQIPG